MAKPKTPQKGSLSYGDIFIVFLKAGFAFGGGLGILAVMERELVEKRNAVSKEEFLTYYSLGRIVPSGTMTALAVAYGYKFGGFPGTLVALAALVLPATVITLILTVMYGLMQGTSVFSFLNVTVLPAAVGLILVSALSLGKDLFKLSRGTVFALAAFASVLFLKANPSLVLLAGGILGILLLKPKAKQLP